MAPRKLDRPYVSAVGAGVREEAAANDSECQSSLTASLNAHGNIAADSSLANHAKPAKVG